MMEDEFPHEPMIIGRFIGAACAFPERPAIEKGNFVMTYRELGDAADRISKALRAAGDDCCYVAVLADKSPECYAAILGILLAGKAYLPINPRFPEARNRFMMEKAGVRHLVAGGRLTSLDPVRRPQHPCNAAYLLFTSGTTGEPKGVSVSNRNVDAYLEFMQNTYGFAPEDRFTQNFDLTFDLSVHDLFLCWSAGACLCIPEDASSFYMAGFIREKRPTAWFSVPSVAMLMERMRLLKPGAFPSIRLSFFCGEPLLAKTAQAWQKAVPGSRIINLYGPTEATIAISYYEIPAENEPVKQEMGIVSIGQIFDGNTCLLDGKITPQKGELWLSGPQVVQDYFENPEADRQAYSISRQTGIRYYKTGDIVRFDSDGDLFYLGRKDSEVKISGYRVNLREIENVISKYDSVAQAVVINDNSSDNQSVLVAFVLPEQGMEPSEADLRSLLMESLPWYMVPGKIVLINEFPLNANGKIDRKALKERYLDGK
jgi:acyl-coenzyme A synthetase/AMP-(fatty) acid ligase